MFDCAILNYIHRCCSLQPPRRKSPSTMRTVLFVLSLLFAVQLWAANGIAIDDFHCKIPTCRDFYYGLRDWPRRAEYEDICYDTVFALQAIPREHGKCIVESTGKLNPPCIYALATLIRTCITRMKDLPEKQARYYCGFTLMKYCAVHLGLDGHPLNFGG